MLLCPLDQRGPFGAATILGCLQYGLGSLSRCQLDMRLWQEAERLAAPSDAAFLSRLERMTPHSLLPPVSLTVLQADREGSHYCESTCVEALASKFGPCFGNPKV